MSKQKTSSSPDAVLFFIIFIGGSFGIYWLKQQGFEQFAVTAVPFTLLIVYAGIVRFVPHFRLREDQAGDNCYYLGFLYTLISLSLALAAFTEAGGTEEIIEDFGIALVSTITGLALRVVFSQMRQDIVEIERETRLELSAAAQRLRSELDQSVIEMNVFRRSTQQSISDGFVEFNSKVGELLERNLTLYEQVTRDSAQRIEKTLVTFDASSQHLSDVTAKTVDAVEALTKRIEAIKTPDDLITTKLSPSLTAIVDIMAGLKERTEAESQAFRELRKMIEETNGAMAGFEGQALEVENVLKGLKQLDGTLGAVERRLEMITKSLGETGKEITTNSSVWRESIEGDAKSITTALEQTRISISTIGDDLRKALSEPAHAAGEALTSIADQANSLREIEVQLKRLPPLLEKEVSALSRLNKENVGRKRFPFLRLK